MDFTEIKVLQAEIIALENACHSVYQRHEKAFSPVHVVNSRGLMIAEPGHRLPSVLRDAVFAGEQDGGGTVGERCRVSGRHGGVVAVFAEYRLELGEFVGGG